MSTKPRAYRPSPTALKVLRNLAAGRSGDHGMRMSMSLSGGLTATFAALRRHGLLTPDGKLTDAGHAAACTYTLKEL